MELWTIFLSGLVANAFNASTQEAEAGEPLWVLGQFGLQSKFQDSQGYTEKLCLPKQKQKEEEEKRKKYCSL